MRSLLWNRGWGDDAVGKALAQAWESEFESPEPQAAETISTSIKGATGHETQVARE